MTGLGSRSLVPLVAVLTLLVFDGCISGHRTPLSDSEHDLVETLRQQAEALTDSALARYQEGDCEAALRYYQRANSLFEKIHQHGKRVRNWYLVYVDMARLHNNLGRQDSALFYLRRAARLLDRNSQAERFGLVLTRIAEIHYSIGQIDSAVFYCQRMLDLMRETSGADSASLFTHIGTAYHILGWPRVALSYFTKSLAWNDTGGARVGLTLNNLGRVFQSLGRPDSAIALFRQSLVHRHKANDRTGEAITLNNIGYSHDVLGRPDSALFYYRSAYATRQRLCLPSDQALTLINMGRVFLALGEPDSSLHYLHRGLAIKEEIGDRLGQSWALNDLGQACLQIGEDDSARFYFESALKMLRQIGDRSREGQTLYNLGRLYHSSTRLRNLALAVAYYDSAAIIRAKVRKHAGEDPNRLSFAEQDVQLFENWALACLARAVELGEREATLSALAAAEQGRAQSLLDLRRTSAGSVSTRSNAIEEMQHSLDLVQKNCSAGLYYLTTQDTLLVWLMRSTGELHLARVAISQDSVASLVNSMRAGIESNAMERAVSSLERQAIPKQQAAVRPRIDAELARILLPIELRPLLPDSGELLICPQGIIGLAPFAALPLDSSGQFLGTRFSLRYTPSLVMLAQLSTREAESRNTFRTRKFPHAIVVGNPAMPEIKGSNGTLTGLSQLPGAEQEAKWLAQKLGARVLMGREASEGHLRRKLSAAQLVHLATHGFAYSSDERARDSFIALAADEENDGILTVGEVMDSGWNISAELIVLSACQTGLGNLKQAEGTIGLQRAFLAKGGRNILVSLWSVSDAATLELMKGFYVHWLDDADRPSKAEALRRAQVDLIRSGFGHPRFWAAFQLVGVGN